MANDEITQANYDYLHDRLRAAEELLAAMFLWFERKYRPGALAASFDWRADPDLASAVKGFAAYGPAQFGALLAAQQGPYREATPSIQSPGIRAYFEAGATIMQGDVVAVDPKDGRVFAAVGTPLPPVGIALGSCGAGARLDVLLTDAAQKKRTS